VRCLIAVVAIAAARVAHADAPVDHQARGEQLARESKFAEAIDEFKLADAAAPSPAHKCLIALAYTRRELWPQAEIFMAQCRADRADQLPPWVPEARALVAARVAEANVAPVTVVVDPAGVGARVSVSSFAPDETFAPGTTIHLPPGHHVLVASAAGYPQTERAIDVVDRSPRQVIIALPGAHPAEVAPSRTPHALIVAGVVALAAGTVGYGVMAVGWDKLRSDDGANFGTRYETMYDVGRVATIALWTAGAALAVTGYVLHRRDAGERIAVVPRASGASLVLELAR
jgi:hypothetical protein